MQRVVQQLVDWVHPMPGSSVPLTHLSQFYEAHPEAKVLIQNARAPQRRNGIDAFVANAHAADRLVLEGSQAIAALRVVDGAPYKLITTLEALDAYVADVENSEVAVMALGTAGHGEDGVAMLQVACDNSSRPVLIDLLVLERTHTRSELGSRIRALLVVPPLKLIHDCHDASSRLACQFSLGGVPVYVKSLLDTQLVHEHAHPDTPWCSFAAMLCTYAPDAAHVTRAADSKKQLKDGDVSLRRPLSAAALQHAADVVRLLLDAWGKIGPTIAADESFLLQRASFRRWTRSARDGPGRAGRAIAFDDAHRLRSCELVAGADADADGVNGLVVRTQRLRVVDTDTDALFALLPAPIASRLSGEPLHMLRDILFDVGRPPRACFVEPGSGRARSVALAERPVDRPAIEAIVRNLTFGPDNRAGMDGSLHRISAMRNLTGSIYGLTMRIGRSVSGTVELVRDLLLGPDAGSVLILGVPGSGKTTVVRDICNTVAAADQSVVIVDASCEIAGDGDVPHASVGQARRMMVASLAVQASVMIEAVQNHTPQVLVIDEIGRAQEVAAAGTVRQRGVRLVASAHGDLRSLVKNTQLRGLVGGVETVLLGDDAAKKTNHGSKTKAERGGAPVFDIVIELRPGEYDSWRVITRVGEAVDAILLGDKYECQRRVRDAGGQLRVVFEHA